MLFELWVLPVLCQVHLSGGNARETAACLERGFELLVPHRSWYGLPADMHLTRGLLARERSDWDEAESSFARALAIDREYGLAWDEARVELEWSRSLRRRGRAADNGMAEERLERARRIFERVGAQRELDILDAGAS